MKLRLVTGGARGGKSRYAQDVAWRSGGAHVTYVAVARASDPEMARRIARHRSARPREWTTLEAPRHADHAVLAATSPTVVLDCLTVLLANAVADLEPATEIAALEVMEAEVDGLLEAAATRTGLLVVVSNEVGFGVHPETAIGRWFRDGLGLANQRVALVADDVVLMVAGIPIPVKGSV